MACDISRSSGREICDDFVMHFVVRDSRVAHCQIFRDSSQAVSARYE